MTRERLYLFDTTLRDGAQMNGVDFTLHDKLASRSCSTISASTTSRAAIRARTRPTPSCSGRSTSWRDVHGLRHDAPARPLDLERSGARDPARRQGRRDLLRGETWDYHVRVALETTNEENLASIRDSVTAAKQKGREALIDCEHFFDGYKANPRYALACARTALRGRRALGRAVRHQWRHAAARGRGDRRRRGQARAGRPCRHPRAQ